LVRHRRPRDGPGRRRRQRRPRPAGRRGWSCSTTPTGPTPSR
jgi:hypothetical protein